MARLEYHTCPIVYASVLQRCLHNQLKLVDAISFFRGKIKMCRIESGIHFLATSGELSTSKASSGNVDNLPQYSGGKTLNGSGGMAGAKAMLWSADDEEQ